MSTPIHCPGCDPARLPDEVRSLSRMRPEALREAVTRLTGEAASQQEPAERRHDIIRAALCMVALERQPQARKPRRRARR